MSLIFTVDRGLVPVSVPFDVVIKCLEAESALKCLHVVALPALLFDPPVHNNLESIVFRNFYLEREKLLTILS